MLLYACCFASCLTVVSWNKKSSSQPGKRIAARNNCNAEHCIERYLITEMRETNLMPVPSVSCQDGLWGAQPVSAVACLPMQFTLPCVCWVVGRLYGWSVFFHSWCGHFSTHGVFRAALLRRECGHGCWELSPLRLKQRLLHGGSTGFLK